jgi:hypothetical protein
MSKAHRGRGIRTRINHGRGTCPVCKRTGVKVVYEREIEKVKVSLCKICNSSKNNQLKAASTAEAPKQETTA